MTGWHMAAVLVLVSAGPVWASMITVNCEDPEGFQIYHGEDVFLGPGIHHDASAAERFGSKPTFILDTDKPNKLIVLWGSYIPEGLSTDFKKSLDLDAKAAEADIVYRNEHQITAIETYQQGVYTYTLYPILGYGLFTQSSHGAISGQVLGWIYYGPCTFD